MLTFGFIGTQEIIIILVIALLVFGPAKLPEIGRQVGSAMREVRKMSSDVQRALDIDGHGSYDTYSSPYSYSSPTPVDQYGLDDAHAGDATAIGSTTPAHRPKFTVEPMPETSVASETTGIPHDPEPSVTQPATSTYSTTENSAPSGSTLTVSSATTEPATVSVSAGAP